MRIRWGIAVLLLLFCAEALLAQMARLPDLDRAVVPVVYPLERSGHTAQGCERIRYTFFGNAFFAGCRGRLLTAAHVIEPFPQRDEVFVLLRVEEKALPGADCWRMVRASVIAADRDADLAILEIPSEHLGKAAADYFTLVKNPPTAGSLVEMALFKPARVESWTDGAARIETRRGQILKTERKHISPETALVDVYLLSADVVPGESGAPLYDPDSGEVVGIVSGISRGGLTQKEGEAGGGRGAAVPVSYIRSLLDRAGCASANH